MRRRLRKVLDAGASRLGYQSIPSGPPAISPDCDPRTQEIVRRVQPFTLTPPERVMALCAAVRHVEAAGVPGAIVECGVWRGGSMMAAAMTLLDLEAADRDLYLFDTFTEFPEPREGDEQAWGGSSRQELFETITTHPVFAHLPIDQVRKAIEDVGYPEARLHLIQGLVEDTIPESAPESIAICRLDTDWYRSTAHELEHLFGRISSGGVLVIDDYGEFLGARKAVDEHFATLERPVFLHRVDASCRLAIID